jgi:hypothetical protein
MEDRVYYRVYKDLLIVRPSQPHQTPPSWLHVSFLLEVWTLHLGKPLMQGIHQLYFRGF